MDGTTREFQHEGAGVSLKLRKCADDLVQRDLDQWFAAYRMYLQGNTVTEDDGKTVRASFDAHWIEEFKIPSRTLTTAGDVNDIHGGYIKWAASQINAVLSKARELPIPLS